MISVSFSSCSCSWIIYISDTSPGVTSGGIQNKNHDSGPNLYLYPYLTVAVSGYLVAWQFQFVLPNSKGFTHAMLWRSEGDNYRLVTDTILSPRNETIGRQELQYIHAQVIRVRQGDFIGVLTTRKSFLAVSSTDDNHLTAKKLNTSYSYLGQPSLSENELQAVGKRDVSLRAFVASKYTICTIYIYPCSHADTCWAEYY